MEMFGRYTEQLPPTPRKMGGGDIPGNNPVITLCDSQQNILHILHFPSTCEVSLGASAPRGMSSCHTLSGHAIDMQGVPTIDVTRCTWGMCTVWVHCNWDFSQAGTVSGAGSDTNRHLRVSFVHD